jgi:outer membrane lipoprotein-sorting protein
VILRTRILEAVANGHAVASTDVQSLVVDEMAGYLSGIDQLMAHFDMQVTTPASNLGRQRALVFGLRLPERHRWAEESSTKHLNEDSTFRRC